MKVIQNIINPHFKFVHIKPIESDWFFTSTLTMVYHMMPGNGLLSSSILEAELRLQKFKMPHRELTEIGNSIYTGTIELYIPKKENNKEFRINKRVLFLNGIFVEPELFLTINNKVGISFKNQTDNSLSKLADKISNVLTPLFKFISEKGHEYPKELLTMKTEEIVQVIKDVRANPVYR